MATNYGKLTLRKINKLEIKKNNKKITYRYFLMSNSEKTRNIKSYFWNYSYKIILNLQKVNVCNEYIIFKKLYYYQFLKYNYDLRPFMKMILSTI